MADFSLHAPDGKRTLAGMVFLRGDQDDSTTLDAVLSAIRFEVPEERDRAENYFREGRVSEEEGRRLEAQVAYANAYYLLPERNDYKRALEETLEPGFRELAHTMEELMSEASKEE